MTTEMSAKVAALSGWYRAKFGAQLSLNDASLPFGGFFDNDMNDGGGHKARCHGSHRRGIDIFAMFGLGVDPGKTLTGLELVSPAARGMRQYTLEPWMDNGPEWAYPEDPAPTIPWIPDFTVNGSVAGPGCPGVTTPPPDAGRFAGTPFRLA